MVRFANQVKAALPPKLPAAYCQIYYLESAFGGFSDIDGTVAFYSRVNALIHSSFTVVDFGCGRGSHSEDPIRFRRELRCLRGKVARVVGLDVDGVGGGNESIDEFRVLQPGCPWPVPNDSTNLIICDCVIEHLPDPDFFFREARRVLVQNGYLCIRTPNVLSYVGVASRLVPNKHHGAVLAKAQPDRKEEDVFPTVYRCNTVFALRRQMATHGFRAVVYGYEAEPSYLNFSKWAYGLGVLHQKFAPGWARPSIFAFGQVG